jgi:hypothetical protein
MTDQRKDHDIGYELAPFPVPDRFSAAHRRFWQRLAAPGAWWSGAERVAIAGEVRQSRNCARCAARRDALSPSSANGAHVAASDLPANAIEAIHRITTDPGRLTRRWFRSVVGGDLSPERYVELLGTLVALVSIDDFCRALGFPLHPLPTPRSGRPSGYRPDAAVMEDAWVPMIPEHNNGGAEADLWAQGRSGNVIRAMSLVPDEVRTLSDLSAAHYLPNHRVADPVARGEHLDRQQMELIAGRVSALNQCYY